MTHQINVTPPVPSIGGTDKGVLLEQALDATTDLLKALYSLEQMAPHARDYVGYGADWRDQFAKAEAEHAARVGTIRMIIQEVEHLGLSLT